MFRHIRGVAALGQCAIRPAQAIAPGCASRVRGLHATAALRATNFEYNRRPMNRRSPSRGGPNRYKERTGYGSSTPYERAEIRGHDADQTEAKFSKFQELADGGHVSPEVIDTIVKGMGHETMTPVQSKSLEAIVEGKDVVAQAKTGTGKTIAFLLPVIERILRENPDLKGRQRYARAAPDDIRGIIISPTRELAEQISMEARKLTSNTKIVTQLAVGGTGKRNQLRDIRRMGCHLLVATPGRLKDLLSSPYDGVSAPRLNTLVLDEGDRLLDDGFAPDIQEIISLLPSVETVDRQTLVFSATIPRSVMGLVEMTLKKDFTFVQTIDPKEVPTHEKVPQNVALLRGLENVVPAIVELSKREIVKAQEGGKPFKAIVFFNSSKEVELNADILDRLTTGEGASFKQHPLHPTRIFYIAASLSQNERTRAAAMFRKAESAILVSTDVTARGMDFPGVTHVIQVGAPPNGEQYVHRLGRTGRGNNTGEGWLILPELEAEVARKVLRGLPLVPNNTLRTAKVDLAVEDPAMPDDLKEIFIQVFRASTRANFLDKVNTYVAGLKSRSSRYPRTEVVDALNRYVQLGLGMTQPPAVPPNVAQMFGNPRNLQVMNSAPRFVGGRSQAGAERQGMRPGFEGAAARAGFPQPW